VTTGTLLCAVLLESVEVALEEYDSVGP